MRTLKDLIDENEIYLSFYKKFGQVDLKSYEYYKGKSIAYVDVKKIIQEDLSKVKSKEALAYLAKKFYL